MQFLQCNIMNDLVVCTLHEGRIYIAEWNESLHGKPGRESNGMLFGYANIESSFGHFFHHQVQGTSCGHSGSNTYYFFIEFCKFNDGISEYILVFRRIFFIRRLFNDLTCILIKITRCMKFNLVLFGLFKAFAFNSDAMQYLWSRIFC